jgi:hypothetical protein
MIDLCRILCEDYIRENGHRIRHAHWLSCQDAKWAGQRLGVLARTMLDGSDLQTDPTLFVMSEGDLIERAGFPPGAPTRPGFFLVLINDGAYSQWVQVEEKTIA